MPPMGFESTIPVFERVNTFRALECVSAVMAKLFPRNQIPCSALTLHGVREFDRENSFLSENRNFPMRGGPAAHNA
jgi:hypothetical protein